MTNQANSHAERPRRRSAQRAAASVLLALAALQLTGCGMTKTTVKPDGAAKAVADVVSNRTGFRPTDVTCPSGVEGKVGVEFDCHFTGPDGPYTARVRITKIDGTDVTFDVQSRLTETPKPTVSAHGAASVVIDVVSSNTGFRPSDVVCPSGMEAKVGVQFDCHFTGPDGPYTAHMRITKVLSGDVYYDVSTFANESAASRQRIA